MTARDAIDRLNRKLAAGQEPFPDAKGAPWPLDHIEIVTSNRIDANVTIPPVTDGGDVCDLWPACGCAFNCEDSARKPLPRWVWPAWLALFALCLVAAWLASHWSTR